MLFIEKELNGIIFNEDDFKPQKNYMPDLVLALRELDNTKTIHFVIDLESAPVLFILYFRKLKQTNNSLDIKTYFRDKSPLLPKVLETYNLKYKDISEYPWELPTIENVSEEVDPYQGMEEQKAQEDFQDDLDKIPDVYYLEED